MNIASSGLTSLIKCQMQDGKKCFCLPSERRPDGVSERILMCGNEAWPKRPSSPVSTPISATPSLRRTKSPPICPNECRKKGAVFVQSESELAAINMVFGASATGKRAMTSSSSPGISLMQEGISYLAAAELPAVVANIMRGGPGLGNIAPSQSDYFQATKGGGHGDYRNIVLAPASRSGNGGPDAACLRFGGPVPDDRDDSRRWFSRPDDGTARTRKKTPYANCRPKIGHLPAQRTDHSASLVHCG